MSWSGGKDSTLALQSFIEDKGVKPDGLLTAYNTSNSRVTMHGVPMTLIRRQARSLGIPLYALDLPENVTDIIYEELISKKYNQLQRDGFNEVIFGDIFLEDLKEYRIDQLNKAGFSYEFPIWGRDTKELIHEFIDLGFKAIIVSLNGEVLSQDFAGQILDKYVVSQFPRGVDPCGENGEFHTFVFDGPIFKHPIMYEKGEIVRKSYPSPVGSGTVDYWFCDLIYHK